MWRDAVAAADEDNRYCNEPLSKLTSISLHTSHYIFSIGVLGFWGDRKSVV